MSVSRSDLGLCVLRHWDDEDASLLLYGFTGAGGRFDSKADALEAWRAGEGVEVVSDAADAVAAVKQLKAKAKEIAAVVNERKQLRVGVQAVRRCLPGCPRVCMSACRCRRA